jgi:hypothetical protein
MEKWYCRGWVHWDASVQHRVIWNERATIDISDEMDRKKIQDLESFVYKLIDEKMRKKE